MPQEQATSSLRTLQNLVNDGEKTLHHRAGAVIRIHQLKIEHDRRLAKKQGLTPHSQDPEKLAKLGTLQFWCYNNHLHEERPNDYQDLWCCFSHVVGLPEHRITGCPTPLTPYQIEYFNKIYEAKEKSKGLTPNKFHTNKGRQMGFTEIVVRIIAYFCFFSYAGWNVGIIAATNGSLARKDMHRMQLLFRNIWEAAVFDVDRSHLVLCNGTTIEAFPASEEAITGDTKYKGIFMDEAAKWKVLDDRPIFNSIMPIINSGAGDLFLVSTPKGPMKMFYTIHLDPKDFIKFKYDIWAAEGNLYTREQIEEMIKNSVEDPNQEYLCMFTFGKDAILGVVGADIRDAKNLEWDVALQQQQQPQQLTREQLEAFVNSGPDDEEEEWTDPREELNLIKPAEQI